MGMETYKCGCGQEFEASEYSLIRECEECSRPGINLMHWSQMQEPPMYRVINQGISASNSYLQQDYLETITLDQLDAIRTPHIQNNELNNIQVGYYSMPQNQWGDILGLSSLSLGNTPEIL